MDTRIAKHKLKIVAVDTKKNVSDLCKKPVNKGMCEKAKFLVRRLRIVDFARRRGIQNASISQVHSGLLHLGFGSREKITRC